MLVISVVVIIATANHRNEQAKLDVLIANRQAISGKDVICPTCRSTIHVPCDGEYTCHICNNDFSYGQHNKIGVTCPHCKKNIFVPGDGEYICSKCYNKFTYGLPINNIIKSNESYNKYYDVLGCNYNATEDEVSKKYKEMVAKFHPDKLISKDLPEELVQLSTQKFIEIQEAYEKIKSNNIKANSPQNSDEDAEAKLHNNWNVLIDQLKTRQHTKVIYYKGDCLLDEKGDFSNKEFYCYADSSLSFLGKGIVVWLLEVNYTKCVLALISQEELEYYTLSSDKTITIINNSQRNIKQEIHLSASAYDIMLKNYPTKDLEYINQQKII
ncbi:DnaJ domain-containing protein [Clostridium sp.]|uniref:J domain-containing protein n=1 Tax=Clostridium sp. TaxID=1506 RepID=UPI0025C6DE22|nr:DnaJ domain-containing protein [Clostridium sp.]